MPRVRTATLDDSDQIARAHIRAWPAAYGHALPAAYIASFDLSEWARRPP